MPATKPSRGVLAVLALTLSWLVATPSAPAQAANLPALGTVVGNAAPSCWWIKQVNPSATDGLYWLQTPTLVAPAQFWCDMTTDGGGWVLVGRGREGWSFFPTGQRSAADINANPSGTAAFPPAALPTATIDGLLDKQPVTSLDDGILLRRAASANGSTTQNVKWRMLHSSGWNWSLAGGNLLSSVEVNGTTYPGGNTKDATQTFAGQVGPGTGANDARRVFTWQWSSHNFKAGFSYGSGVSGSTSASSYLWVNGSEGNAIPFTQVLIRPKLTPFSYPAIPDSGVPGSTRSPILRSQVEALSGWGVTGLVETGDSENQVDSAVLSFAEVGNRVFVGGKFTHVQQGAGGTRFNQPYVAAFDRDTGAWIDTFRPALDGTVWRMAATPDGGLLVAGQFTNVNGVPGTTALAKLDMSGAVVDGWRANLTPPADNSIRALARALDVEGEWAYVGGLFSEITGPSGVTRAMSSLGRVSLATGEPDTAFRPVAGGQVYTLDATPDRVYAVGKFDRVNDVFVNNVAVLHPADGSLVAGIKPWEPSNTKSYQQTVLAVGDKVWQGGSEHSLQVYTAADYTPLKKNITADSGGDFQALATVDGFVYGSGHFSRFNYTDSSAWPALTGATRADKALFVGAWDATSLSYQTEFAPVLHSRNTEGIWALMADSTKCLWFGGDLDSANTQWIGGFGKYCRVDHVAPSVPATPVAKVQSSGVSLTWQPSTDAGGAVKYEVLRNDRVVTSNYGATSYTDPYGTASDRYFVRAVDAAGNRSPSSPLIRANDTKAPSVPTGLAAVVTGSSVALSWNASTDDVGVTGYTVLRNGVVIGDVTGTTTTVSGLAGGSHSFQVQAFDANGNRSAKTAGVSVTIAGPDTVAPTVPRNLAATVNGSEVSLTWTASTDTVGVTGYTVFRNGVSQGDTAGTIFSQAGLPGGSYSYQVQAFDAAGNRSAKTAGVSVTVVGPDTVAPTVPRDLGASVSGSDVTLTWTTSTDNVGVAGYTVYRNGTNVGDAAAPPTTLVGLSPGSYSFQVQAFDAAGNRSAKTAGVSVTVVGPDTVAPTVPKNLVGTADGSSVTLTWTASTDAVGVAGYTVFRNGVNLGDDVGTSRTLLGIATGTASYQVQAFDAAGNRSSKTAPVSVTVS